MPELAVRVRVEDEDASGKSVLCSAFFDDRAVLPEARLTTLLLASEQVVVRLKIPILTLSR